MEELRFSVDEEIYDDRHGHVLSRTGWYVPQRSGNYIEALRKSRMR